MKHLIRLLILITLTHPFNAAANYLQDLKEKGVLSVGVKGDYAPFGSLSNDGKLVGFDVDVARYISDQLGLELDLQTVTSTNRLQKLAQGQIDTLIATLGDTEKRRELVQILEPNYFASGVNLMMQKTDAAQNWADLTGSSVCALRGSLYNKAMAKRHLLNLKIYASTRDGKLALKNGDCRGWLYDDISILSDLQLDEWQDYHIPLPSRLVTPWAIAITKDDENRSFAIAIEDIMADMHRTGVFLELEEKWGLGSSTFLTSQNKLWQEINSDGTPVCERNSKGGWPPICRNQDLLTQEEADGLLAISLWVKDMTGLNITLLHDSYDRDLYLTGIIYMMGLIVISVIGSILFGFTFAYIIMSLPLLISRPIQGLLVISQMTPPLLQLYLIFFGFGAIISIEFGLSLNAFMVACFVFSLYAGAANARALLHSAKHIEDNPDSQGDLPIGWRLYFRLAYGPIMASSVNITKATGMASLIAVPEVIYASTTIQAENGNANVMLNLTVAVYFIAIFLVVTVFEKLKQWETHL